MRWAAATMMTRPPWSATMMMTRRLTLVPGRLARQPLGLGARRSVSAAVSPPDDVDEWKTRGGLSRFCDRRDIEFVLHEVERVEAEEEEVRGVLDSVEGFVNEWGAIDPTLDQNPPKLVTAADGSTSVEVHPETKRLLADYYARGFGEMVELGLPFTVQCAAKFLFGGAFPSNPLGFTVLTHCAADLLEAHGSDLLKAEYLADMRKGNVVGTMALSEPHAGSSLGGIRTTAAPAGDGPLGPEWRIKGDKMWTSAAFHDVTPNTCHMLLARIAGPDTPPGPRGISLFLVPHLLPDGSPNDVEVVGLNKKMGHRALPNCAWSLGGERGGATGYLIGEPHGGLSAMFMMMNAMRIEVGLWAAALGKRGLNESLLYAEEREQGGKRIILHDDVKRMLLQQKAYAEGSFALTMHAAQLHDQQAAGDSEAGALLDSIIEVVKSWPSEWCLEANKWAIQVLGGAGYVQDYPVEQVYRDNRLNMIHEGTAGVHANTLLGRKLSGNKSVGLFARMRASAEAAEAEAKALPSSRERELLAELSASLREAIERAEKVAATYTCILAYVRTYICMHVCAYIRTCIHTYVHTYVRREGDRGAHERGGEACGSRQRSRVPQPHGPYYRGLDVDSARHRGCSARHRRRRLRRLLLRQAPDSRLLLPTRAPKDGASGGNTPFPRHDGSRDALRLVLREASNDQKVVICAPRLAAIVPRPLLGLTLAAGSVFGAFMDRTDLGGCVCVTPHSRGAAGPSGTKEGNVRAAVREAHRVAIYGTEYRAVRRLFQGLPKCFGFVRIFYTRI